MEMKETLTQTSVLRFSDVCKELEFITDTDSSFDRTGAVLSQRDDNNREKVIMNVFHAMNNHKKVILFRERRCWLFSL